MHIKLFYIVPFVVIKHRIQLTKVRKYAKKTDLQQKT